MENAGMGKKAEENQRGDIGRTGGYSGFTGRIYRIGIGRRAGRFRPTETITCPRRRRNRITWLCNEATEKGQAGGSAVLGGRAPSLFAQTGVGVSTEATYSDRREYFDRVYRQITTGAFFGKRLVGLLPNTTWPPCRNMRRVIRVGRPNSSFGMI